MLLLDAYRATIARDAPAVGAAVAAAPDAVVPWCPGWTTSDVALHLGGVHRWAAAVVRTGEPLPEVEGAGDPLGWYAGGWPDLLAALDGADPGAPCWGLGPQPRLASFWWRRQAHETALHLWDVRAAAGLDATVDDALAADGVDEVVTVFAPRQVRLGRTTVPERAVELASPGGRWRLGDGEPAATVHAGALELLLLLWKRRPLAGLSVAGDPAAARAALDRPLTP